MIPNNPNQYPNHHPHRPPSNPTTPQRHPHQPHVPASHPQQSYPYTPQRPPTSLHHHHNPQHLPVPSPSRPQQLTRSPSTTFEIRIPTPKKPGVPSTPSRSNPAGAMGSPTTSTAYLAQQQLLAQNSDKPNLMISLAESYFARAHGLGVRVVQDGVEERTYYKLVSTGLGLLETVLKKGGPPNQSWKLAPRLECSVRLRYAHVLHEETENVDKVEEVLNKGILIAQRNNLLDLKYAMQHLLVRVMFLCNTKASLALLNSITADADQRDAPYWQYAFRFLRTTLLLEDSTYRDPTQAANILRSISNIAHRREDWHIFMFTNLMDAMHALQAGPSGIESATRALGRIQQIVSQIQLNIPVQLQYLYGVIDVACSIMTGNVPITQKKLIPIHNILNLETFKNWKGSLELQVNPTKPGRAPDYLRISWLSKADTMLLGYFLSGIAGIPVNVMEGHKPEKFILEGLKKVEAMLSSHVDNESLSVTAASGKYHWRQLLRTLLETYRCFLLVARTDWDSALASLSKIERTLPTLPASLLPPTFLQTLTLLRGTVAQSTNSLPLALHHYSLLYTPLLHHPPTTPLDPTEPQILAAINASLILHGPTHSNPPLASHLLSLLTPLPLPPSLSTALSTALATTTPELLKSKKLLSQTLNLAMPLSLKQPIYIVLAFMSHRFFRDIVSEQAEKSARAAWVNARKCGDRLWTGVGGEMLAEVLARRGEGAKAAEQRAGDGVAWEAVRANLEREEEGEEEDAEGEEDDEE